MFILYSILSEECDFFNSNFLVFRVLLCKRPTLSALSFLPHLCILGSLVSACLPLPISHPLSRRTLAGPSRSSYLGKGPPFLSPPLLNSKCILFLFFPILPLRQTHFEFPFCFQCLFFQRLDTCNFSYGFSPPFASDDFFLRLTSL